MNLKPGGVITKINGVIPKSTEGFYGALQSKATGAFCKLEALDTKGELRLAQTALYAGGHNELGIVFVEQDHKWDTEASLYFLT